MGVVRREGDWRLEKRADGLYEITYQKNVQTKVLTPGYSSKPLDNPAFDTVPVREVGSYAEAEGLFEEMAHGGPPSGFGSLGGGGFSEDFGGKGIDTVPEENGSLEDVDLPPGGIAVALLLAGGLIVSQSGFALDSTVFQLGAVLVVGGVAIFGWAGVLFGKEGLSEAVDFLITVEEDSSSSSGSDETETTPPASEKLKNALIFDRAGQQCEWCEQSFDHPHVHHIEPRREGGPNEPSNLIVLCPNCHEKADREAIPRSKLRAKVKRQPDISVLQDYRELRLDCPLPSLNLAVNSGDG